MQVQYRETKTGFDCIHMPSIDLTSVQHPPPLPSASATPTPTVRTGRHRKEGSTGSNDSGARTVARKTSKLSFSMGRKERERENGNGSGAGTAKEKELPSRPSGGTVFAATPSSGSSSFFNVSNSNTVTGEEKRQQQQQGGDAAVPAASQPEDPPRTPSPPKGKNLPPIPRDFAATPQPGRASPLPTGEIDRDIFESIGQNTLSVRFEINIVKVPWLPLHGIQFRRASGDGWQYQMLARRVLTELKL